MALSVHFNAYNQKGLTGGVQAHQERFSEKEALHALKNTKSNIDPSETQYNVSLYRDEVLETKTFKRVAKELTDQFQANREKAGLKRKRSDFKTMMVGTFQISDDTLELLGYDKAKKWSEHNGAVRMAVTEIYSRMVKNALNKPDYYGRIMTATLHVDESTPHVDFMCIGVDPKRLNFGVREILNGEETKDPKTGKRRYMPKGAKLSEIQDDLSTIFADEPEFAHGYGLVRGNKTSENLAHIRDLRSKIGDVVKYEVALDDRDDELDEKEKHLTEKELKLASKESEIDSREVQLEETKERLDKREQALNRRESTLNDKDKALSGLKSDYADLKTRYKGLEGAYQIEKRRRIALEATYEYNPNNLEHALYKHEQLEQNKKTPQKPRQQTKDNGYSL
jgi:hypothetical protein